MKNLENETAQTVMFQAIIYKFCFNIYRCKKIANILHTK